MVDSQGRLVAAATAEFATGQDMKNFEIVRNFVIIGRGEDPCCALVRERLTKLGQEVLFLDETRLFPGLRLAWDLSN